MSHDAKHRESYVSSYCTVLYSTSIVSLSNVIYCTPWVHIHMFMVTITLKPCRRNQLYLKLSQQGAESGVSNGILVPKREAGRASVQIHKQKSSVSESVLKIHVQQNSMETWENWIKSIAVAPMAIAPRNRKIQTSELGNSFFLLQLKSKNLSNCSKTLWNSKLTVC